MKNRFTFILILCTCSFMLSSQVQFDLEAIAKKYLITEFKVRGKVLDRKTNEPIMFANVALFTTEGILISGAETDLDGQYLFPNVEAGTYYIESSFIGYITARLANVHVSKSIVALDIEMTDQAIICGIYCPRYIKPLIRQDDTTSGMIMTASEIRHMR